MDPLTIALIIGALASAGAAGTAAFKNIKQANQPQRGIPFTAQTLNQGFVGGGGGGQQSNALLQAIAQQLGSGGGIPGAGLTGTTPTPAQQQVIGGQIPGLPVGGQGIDPTQLLLQALLGGSQGGRLV